MFDHKLQEFEVDPFLDDFPSVQISDLAFSNIIIKKKKNKKDFQWIFRFETTPKIIFVRLHVSANSNVYFC